MLKIQQYIKTHGIEKTISNLNLHANFNEHKVCLRYDQLKSDFKKQETCESRSLVLETQNWNVLSLPFTKFFTHNDTKATKIDWESAYITEKRDGSLITLYFDYIINKWCFSTMGDSIASGKFKINNELSEFSFHDVCFDLIKDKLNNLNINYLYIFELTSPYNKVVTTYTNSKLTLLTIRNQKTLIELNKNDVKNECKRVDLELVKQYTNFKSLDELLKSFETKPFDFEGYVVCDKYFNRIKVKNPAYVKTHLLKCKDGINLSKPHYFVEIIKSNEIDEFISSFPETKSIVSKMYTNYKKLLTNLETIKSKIEYPKDISTSENKKFATNVFKLLSEYKIPTTLSSLFFKLKNNKSINIQNEINQIDIKKLYNILK